MPYHALSGPICLCADLSDLQRRYSIRLPCLRLFLCPEGFDKLGGGKQTLKHKQDPRGDIDGCPIPWYAATLHSETTLHSLTRFAALYQRLVVCISCRNTNSAHSMHTNE